MCHRIHSAAGWKLLCDKNDPHRNEREQKRCSLDFSQTDEHRIWPAKAKLFDISVGYLIRDASWVDTFSMPPPVAVAIAVAAHLTHFDGFSSVATSLKKHEHFYTYRKQKCGTVEKCWKQLYWAQAIKRENQIKCHKIRQEIYDKSSACLRNCLN